MTATIPLPVFLSLTYLIAIRMVPAKRQLMNSELLSPGFWSYDRQSESQLTRTAHVTSDPPNQITRSR
jgi:hypothetical protein